MPHNHPELAIEERGAIHLLTRAVRHLTADHYFRIDKQLEHWTSEAHKDAKHSDPSRHGEAA